MSRQCGDRTCYRAACVSPRRARVTWQVSHDRRPARKAITHTIPIADGENCDGWNVHCSVSARRAASVRWGATVRRANRTDAAYPVADCWPSRFRVAFIPCLRALDCPQPRAHSPSAASGARCSHLRAAHRRRASGIRAVQRRAQRLVEFLRARLVTLDAGKPVRVGFVQRLVLEQRRR